MQKLTLPIALIALAGVIGLFMLQLSGGTEEIKTMAENPATGEVAVPKIAYVQIDSLVAKYERHQELNAEFEKEVKMAELKLQAAASEFEKNVEVYSRRAPELSPADRQEAELELQQLQVRLQQQEQQAQQNLLIRQQELNKALMDDLNAVIEKVQQELGLDLVLSKEEGGNVLYAGPQLDITDKVATYLNEEYHKGENEGDVEADK